VAVLVRAWAGEIIESRVALAGVSERPLRLGGVESAVTGARAEDLPDRVGPIGGLDPATDTSSTADHRRHLARVLTVRSLGDALARAGQAT
jgi:carbon-monoxide dehydrogenase medium subunit